MFGYTIYVCVMHYGLDWGWPQINTKFVDHTMITSIHQNTHPKEIQDTYTWSVTEEVRKKNCISMSMPIACVLRFKSMMVNRRFEFDLISYWTESIVSKMIYAIGFFHYSQMLNQMMLNNWVKKIVSKWMITNKADVQSPELNQFQVHARHDNPFHLIKSS